MKSVKKEADEFLIIALIKKLQLIYFSLLGGILLFSGLMMYEVEVLDFHSESDLDTILKVIVPLTGITGFIGGKFLYKTMLKQAQASEGKMRLDQFESANILQYASIEGPSIFAVIAYILTTNAFYLIIVEILVIVYLFHKPSLSKFYFEMSADL